MSKKDGNNFDTQTEDTMDTIIYASIKSLLLVMLVVMLIAVGIPLLASIFTVEAEAAELPAITESCGLSEEELSGALKGKLAEYAPAFIAAEQDTGINAAFLAAIAAHESGWGESRLAQNKNNLFGWKCSSGFKAFETPEECIGWIAGKLKEKYINAGYDTIEKIAPRYCNAEWANYIEGIYGGICNMFEKLENEK